MSLTLFPLAFARLLLHFESLPNLLVPCHRLRSRLASIQRLVCHSILSSSCFSVGEVILSNKVLFNRLTASLISIDLGIE